MCDAPRAAGSDEVEDLYVMAQALWCTGPGQAELRPAASPMPGLRVRTRFSAISRGTEKLVFEGRVPVDQFDIMKAPYQEGSFPFPVKYGYAAVGDLEGDTRCVFALFPHQTEFCLPREALISLPEEVPPERAVLAANMETALNILWDSGAGAGDRIAVIGAGLVGMLAGYLAARLPGAEVTLVDLNADRSRIAHILGCEFASPEAAPKGCDVVIHTSASSPGLNTALNCAGHDATVVEASWYGSASVSVALGGVFHSARLRLISSQVGALPPVKRPRWSHHRRLTKALELLKDDVLDTLISGETRFEDLPAQYAAILASPDTLCHRIVYS